MTALSSCTDHVTVVRSLYEAFGRGDLDAMLAALADDVSWDADWSDSFAHRAGLELMRPRRGREEVRAFFGVLAGLTVHDFQVLDLLASETQVVAQIVIEVSYPNGGRFRDEELHLWTLDDAGRIIRLRHHVDTAKHIAAANGEDTTRR